eukprot:2904488-Rhodomonas_salina.1
MGNRGMTDALGHVQWSVWCTTQGLRRSASSVCRGPPLDQCLARTLHWRRLQQPTRSTCLAA